MESHPPSTTTPEQRTTLEVYRAPGNDPDDIAVSLTGDPLTPDGAIEVIGIAMDHALVGLDLAAIAGFQAKLLAKLSRPPAPAADDGLEGFDPDKVKG